MTKPNEKPAILLIYTGGTIGMKTDPDTGALAPFDFNGIYEEFPNLRYLDADIEVMPFDPIDSSNVTPELWERLALLILDRYSEFDGFVVLHGTDTMSYTASALSFMLENLGKPVIFTGSQIPIGVMRTDGRENLITAIELAAAKKDGRACVPEVCLYFQNKLMRANRTTKFSAEELDAFRCYNFPALADVGVNIHYKTPFIHRPAEGDGPLAVDTRTCTDIAVVTIFPGITEPMLRTMFEAEGLRGVILRTYGSGNAPTSGWFLDVVRGAVDRGIVVMNVSQCPSGSVAMDLYDTGVSLMKAGIISGRDITLEAAVTKMICVLGRFPDPREARDFLKISLRGEISA